MSHCERDFEKSDLCSGGSGCGGHWRRFRSSNSAFANKAREPVRHSESPSALDGHVMLFYLSSAVLTAALCWGGGTHVGFLGDVALQFLAIPLLCMALWPAFSQQSPHRKKARLALWICGIAALVPAIQLSPLHLDYWFRRYGFAARKLRRLACGARSSHPYPHTRGGLGRGTISNSSAFDFCRQRSA